MKVCKRGYSVSIINNRGLEKTDDDKETDRLVKEYLTQGGEVTACASGATTPDIGNLYGWGKRKPQAKPKE
jgi:hypothetical protein